jgi:hypothetical protein
MLNQVPGTPGTLSSASAQQQSNTQNGKPFATGSELAISLEPGVASPNSTNAMDDDNEWDVLDEFETVLPSPALFGIIRPRYQRHYFTPGRVSYITFRAS